MTKIDDNSTGQPILFPFVVVVLQFASIVVLALADSFFS